MTLAEFIEAALPVPYVEYGRTFDAWDCWGLVRCAYREVLGIELNSLDGQYSLSGHNYTELHRAIRQERSEWIEVSDPQIMDVRLFRIGKFDTHATLVIGRNRMLHCERTAGTIIEEMNGLIWGSNRHVGYFRRQPAIG